MGHLDGWREGHTPGDLILLEAFSNNVLAPSPKDPPELEGRHYFSYFQMRKLLPQVVSHRPEASVSLPRLCSLPMKESSGPTSECCCVLSQCCSCEQMYGDIISIQQNILILSV